MVTSATQSESALAADREQLLQQIIERIDRGLSMTVNSPPIVDDATFLRRASLDLVGHIATVAEVRGFLASQSVDKRQQLIQDYIGSGAYARNMATFWRRVWVPQADTPEFVELSEHIDLWITQQLQQNTPYDQIVSRIVTFNRTQISPASVSPSAFYLGNESKPANVAAAATRAFLGINLECAQCHDHPFARWSRDQFWETAAFFVELELDKEGKLVAATIQVPETDQMVSPRLLTEEPMGIASLNQSQDLRTIFSQWMQTEANCYLAKNAVNRLWSHFFGMAIVEPMDDLSRTDSVSKEQAELLEELAELFIQSNYDLDLLTTAIGSSRRYNLDAQSVEATLDHSNPETRRPTVRGLTGEQLFDSLVTAAGQSRIHSQTNNTLRMRDPRRDFVRTFFVDRPHNAERSITQTLALMNGVIVNDICAADNNSTISALASSPFMTDEERIESLYLAVLGRPPRTEEVQAIQQHNAGQPSQDQRAMLSELFWVLINGPEFSTNR